MLENTPAVHNVVVCTLCSCYPWPVLGLPPRWYKSFAYRARGARAPGGAGRVRHHLPDDVEVRVWDSERRGPLPGAAPAPAGTEGLAEDELAPVTRDHMIGVVR